jgi:hypothetical protein
VEKTSDFLALSLGNLDDEAISAENGPRTWRKFESNTRWVANDFETLALVNLD